MPFDGSCAYSHVENLSFPRRTGSQGGDRAATYILDFFKDIGLNVEVQEFRFSTTPHRLGWSTAPLFLSFVGIIAVFLLPNMRPISGVLCTAILFSICATSRWNGLVEKIFNIGPEKTARNIIARRTSASKEVELIFVAHYDSKSQPLSLVVRFLLFFSGVLLILGVCLAVIISAIMGDIVLPYDFLRWTAFASFILFLPLSAIRSKNGSPGALDNGSGVGILLELARCTEELDLERTNLTFLTTGAEEEGMVGAMRYIQRKEDSLEVENTFFVNYEMIGVGDKLSLITAHGVPPVRTAKRLSKIGIRAAEQERLRVLRSYLPFGAGMDHMPIAWRGFDAITLLGEKFNRPFFRAHSPRDTPDGIDPKALERAGRLGLRIAQLLDSMPPGIR